MFRRKYIIGLALLLSAPLKSLGAEPTTLRGDLGRLHCLVFAPDGKTVALAGDSATVEVWDLTTRKRSLLKDHAGKVTCLAFSLDGKILAVGSYKQVKLWEVAGWKELTTLKGHTTDLQSLHFLSDGKSLFTASRLDARRWPLNSDDKPVTYESKEPGVWAVTANGKLFAKSQFYWNNVGLWDAKRGTESLLIRASWTNATAFSADGGMLVLGHGEHVRLCNTTKGETLATHELHTAKVRFVEISPDGKTLLSGSEDKTAILWDVAGKREQATLKGHKGMVVPRFFRDGKLVFTASPGDEVVRFWDADTGKEVGTLREKAGVQLAVVTPDGKTLATVLADGTVRLWDVDAVLQAAR